MVLTVHFNIRHNHSQHPLMNIDSSYPVWHRCLLRRERRACEVDLERGWLLLARPAGGRRPAPITRVMPPAPDQTNLPPQMLHCYVDLAASQHPNSVPALNNFHEISGAGGPGSAN